MIDHGPAEMSQVALLCYFVFIRGFWFLGHRKAPVLPIVGAVVLGLGMIKPSIITPQMSLLLGAAVLGLDVGTLFVRTPRLSHARHFEEERRRAPGWPMGLSLSQANASSTGVTLLYRWHLPLSPGAADRLDSRLRAYIACAIFDAARHAGLKCTEGPPQGRRPSWIIKGCEIPIGLQQAGFDVKEKSCLLSVGPIILGRSRCPETISVALMNGFFKKFTMLRV